MSYLFLNVCLPLIQKFSFLQIKKHNHRMFLRQDLYVQCVTLALSTFKQEVFLDIFITKTAPEFS